MIRRQISVALAGALILLIIAAHRFSPAQASELLDAFIHSLHGPGFAAVAAAAWLATGPTNFAPRRYIVAAASATLIAGLSEAAQIPGPRDAEFSDLGVDILGIVGALGVIALFDRSLSSIVGRWRRALIGTIGFVSLTGAMATSLFLGYAIVARTAAFPVLLVFDGRWQSSIYWQTHDQVIELIRTPDGWPIESGRVASAVEDGEDGILIRFHPSPDWTGYEALSFVAASVDGAELPVLVSVRDLRPKGNPHNNRFYQEITVDGVPKRFRIEIRDIVASSNARPFDLENVRTVVLSAPEPGSGVAILVDDFRLIAGSDGS